MQSTLMTSLAQWIGLILIVTGLAGYLVTGAASVTALIPAFLGILLLASGIIGRREHLRKHAMHAAAVLALLGFLGSLRGVGPFFTLLAGGTVDLPVAAVTQTITAVASAVFIVFAVRSFIEARRQAA